MRACKVEKVNSFIIPLPPLFFLFFFPSASLAVQTSSRSGAGRLREIVCISHYALLSLFSD